MRHHEDASVEVMGKADHTRREGDARRPWSAPTLEALPPLNSLTLLSIPGEGVIGDGGGSTVF